MITQRIKLNLVPNGIMPVVYVTVGDNVLPQFEVEILNGTEPFAIPSGYTVIVQGTKPDNRVFSEACTFSGNVVTVTVTNQMTAYDGDILSSLAITDGTGIVETLKFILSVKRSSVDEYADLTDSDISLLQQMPTLVGRAEDAATRAEQAAGVSADGTTIAQNSSGVLSVSPSVLGTTLKGLSLEGITTYPTAVGVYRITAGKPTGLPGLASPYGELMIYGFGYFTHIYQGYSGDIWVGRTEGTVQAPPSWNPIQMYRSVNVTETDLDNLTSLGIWCLPIEGITHFPPTMSASVTKHCIVEVTRGNGGMLVQKLILTNNSAYPTYAGRMWQRVYFSSSAGWTEWQEIVTSQTFRMVNTTSVGDDCDTLITPGIFPRIISNSATNGPGFYCYLINFSSGADAYITQIGIDVYTYRIAMRHRNNGTWNAWKILTAV